jgi:hypothetical protein
MEAIQKATDFHIILSDVYNEEDEFGSFAVLLH